MEGEVVWKKAVEKRMNKKNFDILDDLEKMGKDKENSAAVEEDSEDEGKKKKRNNGFIF